MFDKNYSKYNEYKHFSPYRKPIENKKLIKNLIDSEFSAYIQHISKDLAAIDKKIIKNKIKKKILNVLDFHKLDNVFDNQIFPYLNYRKKINKKFSIYEI